METHSAPAKRPRVAFETMGCKLNLADTELLAQDFRRAGFQVVPPDGDRDVYVLNTCTVTHVADRKARHVLRAARRKFPQAYIVATGCYAQRAPGALTQLPDIDLVAGNTSKPVLAELVAKELQARPFLLAGPSSDPAMAMDDGLPPRGALAPHQTRAFVKIQEGCNDYCSYCIIPKTRGASRFFPPQQIITAVQAREAAGYKEVVLTGTQLGDYGIEKPGSRRAGPDRRNQASQGNPLAAVLRRLLRETAVPRLRLSSLQPQDVTPELLDLWRDPRLCRHLHLPLQSGSDCILRRMRRRYTAQEYAGTVEQVREALPDVSITTDVLVGFPGETDEAFEATLILCKTLKFAAVHVFPFSPRQGTLAARWIDLVPERVKQERVQRLLEVARRSSAEHREHFWGDQRPVLWEELKLLPEVSARPVWHGLTDNYLRVYTSGEKEIDGAISRTRLVENMSEGIWGEIVT